MMITDLLFEAFLACKTKARLHIEDSSPDCQQDRICVWQHDLFNEYQQEFIRTLLPEGAGKQLIDQLTIDSPQIRQSHWIAGAELKSDELSSSPPLIENLAWNSKATGGCLIPVRIFPNESIHPNQKMLLAYDALVIGKLAGQIPAMGKLVYGRQRSVARIKLGALVERVAVLLDELRSMIEGKTAPDFTLNGHCQECKFECECLERAVREDDISLLKVIAPREAAKMRERGIFTVTQLARSFRPRRRRARGGAKTGKYPYALKARALCDKTTYMVGSPDFKLDGTLVYLDVEGVPEEGMYYLIGAKVVSGDSSRQYSFWADGKDDEAAIWRELLSLMSTLYNPLLLHYGGYETAFLKAMQSRHGHAMENGFSIRGVAAGAINVLAVMRPHIFFPTRSNGLKEVARHLGFRWSTESPSGLKSLLLRRRWELSGDERLKSELIVYNGDDCAALERVADAITALIENAGSAVQADLLKDTSWPYSYGKKEFAFPELAKITKCAYWDYQRDRVYVRTNKRIKAIARRRERIERPAAPTNRVISASRPPTCPGCGAACFSINGRHERTVHDLRFTSGGVKRWVVKYIVDHYKCDKCGATFASDAPLSPRLRHGPQLFAYVIHSLIGLHIAQFQLAKIIRQFFGLPLNQTTIGAMKSRAAELYRGAFEEIRSSLTSGSLIHADETHVSVDGRDSYVWVFTNMEEVVYLWSATREAKPATDFLSGFKGVLVSDFYAAYDSIACPQQKCLIHLTRDLNDALLKEPFNLELRGFAREFTGLLTAIVATVDRFGLKRHHLKKHIPDVDGFFETIVAGRYETASTRKLQTRFKKHRGKLFTFLDHDNVPWNNNNAEHAVKAFGRGMRDDIDGRTNERGIADYLTLLSIYQTCEYRGIDFLGFLRSGATQLSAYQSQARQPRTRHRRIPGLQGSDIPHSDGQ